MPVVLFLCIGAVFFPLTVGAQNSASPVIDVSTSSILPSTAYPVTLEIDGYVFSVTANAEQAEILKRWESTNHWTYWGFTLFMIFFAASGWEILRYKWWFESNRARLFSHDLQEAIRGANGLAGHPTEAYRLVLRWAQEYRLNKKYFERETMFDSEPQQIIQAIQNALDGMIGRTSYLVHWNPVHPRLPQWMVYPHFEPIQGARLEEKMLTIDLGPIQLKGAYMIKCNLCKTSMQNAKLWDANLRHANLSFCSLQETVFSEAHLDYADLSYANLEGANLHTAHMEGVNLTGAHLEMACFNNARLDYANLSRSYIKRTLLSGASLQGVNFTAAHLEETDLAEARLEGAIFHQAFMKRVYFLRTHLEGAHLADVNLEDVHLEEGEFLSYAQRQNSQLNSDQEDLALRWNATHHDAPWLQEEWMFWWQYPEADQHEKRREEILAVRTYIDSMRNSQQK